MLLGALIDAGADTTPIQKVFEIIPRHYSKCQSIRLDVHEVRKHGFKASQVDFDLTEDSSEVTASQMHQAAEQISTECGIGSEARSLVLDSVERLLRAESKIHGVEASLTHMHEMGSTDTLADIFGVAVACELLGVFEGEVCCTPVAVGGGMVSFSHGTISNPAPATLEILKESGMSMIAGPEDYELSTPTGVAILAALAKKGTVSHPLMVPEKIGYGAGKRELKTAPNVLRVVLGRTTTPGIRIG